MGKGVRRSAFGAQRSTFGVRRSTFGVRRSASGVDGDALAFWDPGESPTSPGLRLEGCLWDFVLVGDVSVSDPGIQIGSVER
jgi:hypothetical protein